jgi:hypothetical protein
MPGAFPLGCRRRRSRILGGMITDAEIARFAADGAVTIDGAIDPTLIADAAACCDRLLARDPASADDHRMQLTSSFFDQPLLDLMQHPFLEQVAQRALAAERVVLRATAIAKTYPEPGREFSFWEHVDVKYLASELAATPRRMICSCLVWLTDVTMDRAPMMFRPGSHRQIAEAMERDPRPIDDPQGVADLPRLPYVPAVPLLARAGQVTVCTTAVIHGASICTGALPRSVVFLPFSPKGLRLRANMAIADRLCAFNRELRRRFRLDRVHLVPDDVEMGVEPASAAR